MYHRPTIGEIGHTLTAMDHIPPAVSATALRYKQSKTSLRVFFDYLSEDGLVLLSFLTETPLHTLALFFCQFIPFAPIFTFTYDFCNIFSSKVWLPVLPGKKSVESWLFVIKIAAIIAQSAMMAVWC